jgi:hypothetical protein
MPFSDETQLFSRVKVPTTFKNSNGQILLCMVDGWIEQQVHCALVGVCQLQQLQQTPSLMPHSMNLLNNLHKS